MARYDRTEGLLGALRILATLGVNDVLVEPGPRLLAALVAEGVLDELTIVQAGGFAGDTAPSLFAGPSDASGATLVPRMVPLECGIVGTVAVSVWRRDGMDDLLGH
jgi:riboflavin biosynthesis pyrimidine reductase